MSAHNMHPTFTDRAGYVAWIENWRLLYKRQTASIRKSKNHVKALQRNVPRNPEEPSREYCATTAAKAQRELHFQRVMARKTMTLLESAKIRWARLREMKDQIDQQMASFPLTLDCPMVDFHFNKGSLEFPILPAWTLKAKGKTFYVNHVDFADAIGTTRETPDHPSTKGAIRFRRCTLTLNPDGTAAIMRQNNA